MKKYLPTILVASAVFMANVPPLQAKTLEQKIATAEVQLAQQAQKININTASASQLQTLPGIGVKKAADIVAYRDTNGLFGDVAELQNVKGIGAKMLDKLRQSITVK